MIVIGAVALRITSPKLIRDAWAQSGERAVGFVKSTSEQLVVVVNSSGSPQEMHEQLRKIIESTVDVDDVAQFCLGRFWRLATPDQLKQYMALFRDVLVIKIANHLGEFKGVQVIMGLARRSADTDIVITTIEGARTSTHRVDWVISTATGTPKIVDLLAGGTSLRLIQSADFISTLRTTTIASKTLSTRCAKCRRRFRTSGASALTQSPDSRGGWHVRVSGALLRRYASSWIRQCTTRSSASTTGDFFGVCIA
jgi:phospholipid transport system substrate-binding protein